MDNSKIFFEFGSGGSTQQAAKRKLKIYSVEIGPSWIALLKKEMEKVKIDLNLNIDITYLFVDLQSNLDITYTDFKNYVQIYNHSKFGADLIYIDGKYHFSCLMNIYNQVNEKMTIIIHDLENKSINESISAYFDTLEEADNTIVLKKKHPPPLLSTETIEKVQRQDFTFSNKKSKFVTFFRKNFSGIYEKYKNYNNEDMVRPAENLIWFFWWDGMKKAPYIVQICLSSIKRNFPAQKVIFIDKRNYKKYAKVPAHVVKKFKEGKISKTHFSDVFRMKLLATKGGLWLDSTILVVKKIPTEIFEYPFYTVHFRYTFEYFNGKWCTFLLASHVNNVVAKFCYDMLVEYHMKYDDVFDYFLLDYIFIFGYELLPAFRRSLQKVPLNNQNVMEFQKMINLPWDDETKKIYDGLKNDTMFFKLTCKKKKIKVIKNKKTVFGMLMDEYLK